MGEKLKRCPFCGGRAVIAKEISLFSVGCMLCGANVGATINKETAICGDVIAIEQLPSALNVGKWEEKSVFEDETQQWQSARCSVCDKYHTTPYLYYFDNFNYCPNCGASMEVTE